MPVRVTGCAFLAVLLCVAPRAWGAAAPPSGDILEFLGTYETSTGKAMDPMALSDAPGKSPVPAKAKKIVRKKKSAKKITKKKEGRYE